MMYASTSALVLILSTSLSSAFLAASPRGGGGASRYGFRSCATTTMAASDPGGSTTRTSRRAFVEGGAAALLASVAAVALPPPSLAKLDISEVKGLDVNEVMHLGAGSSGGKATKPLRDCLLNVERVRVSTKQASACSMRCLGDSVRLLRTKTHHCHGSFVRCGLSSKRCAERCCVVA